MFSRLKTYLRESWGELKKLNFPKREEVINGTIIIIIFSLVMGIFFGVVDIFSKTTSSWIVDSGKTLNETGTLPDIRLPRFFSGLFD